MNAAPKPPFQESELEEHLSRPTSEDVDTVRTLGGDFLLLGAGGKMGPTLAMRLKRAIKEAGSSQRVTAVSRFTDERAVQTLTHSECQQLVSDLLKLDTSSAILARCTEMAQRNYGDLLG